MFDYAEEIRPLYPQDVNATSDFLTHELGFAGGGKSILKETMAQRGQLHRWRDLQRQVLETRCNQGGTCQVTPAENAISHEALRIIGGGDPTHSFYPGFQMALTDWGETPAPQNIDMVKQALFEKLQRYVKKVHAESKISDE